MERLNKVADKLVYLAGIIVPVVFVPQIYLLLTEKTTVGISITMLLLSFLVQALHLFKYIVTKQKSLIFSMSCSLIPLSAVICLVFYYRYLGL